MNWNNKFETPVPQDVLWKITESVYSKLHKCVQNSGTEIEM